MAALQVARSFATASSREGVGAGSVCLELWDPQAPGRSGFVAYHAHTKILRIVHPVYANGTGISACALAFADAWQRAGVPVEYWALGASANVRRHYHRLPVPSLRVRLHYKFARPEALIARRVELAVLDVVEPGDIVHLWPQTTLEFAAELGSRGVRIVIERVNSHRENARAILDRLYAVHGLERRAPLTPTHAHTRYEALRETRKLELADAIITPSPFVTNSLLASGLDPRRFIHSSFGWDPLHFQPHPRTRRHGPIRFVHLGSDVLRKGLGELLAAWRLAGGPGELHAIGEVPPALAKRWSSDLTRDDVHTRVWVDDVAALLGQSDVYVLASHEEGSPISTYLAMAAGLPCLVSPAAAGGVVRDGIDGIVCDPFDVDAWSNAMHRLASDAALREYLGNNGRERIQHFTYERVAQRRWREFERRLRPARRADAA